MQPIAGQRVCVFGLGRFGGGEGLVVWLQRQGAEVSISDRAEAAHITPVLDRIESLTGTRPTWPGPGHETPHATRADLVVVNPAVPRPWNNPFLQAAREAGVPLTTAMRLLVERLPDWRRIVGITGSVGKSTTTAMVHHALCELGLDARIGGNFGGSLLPDLDTITADTRIVLECSSAQLHWLDRHDDWPGWSPHVALTTNIEPNHIDWHGDEAHYRRCKGVIERFQQPGDHALHTDELDDMPIALRLPGRHNQANAQLAIGACMALERLDHRTVAQALATFGGLPHRLQPLDDGPTPRFWNDAKSSTPGATLLALDAFDDRRGRIHLLAGGYDKGVSLDAIAAEAPRLAGLHCYGATGPAIAAAAGAHATCSDTLDEAFAVALARASDDHLVLLSPACASWDQFADFRARGERFAYLVNQLNSARPTS